MKSRAKSDTFPTITVSLKEKETGCLSSETLKDGFDLFQKNGCLLVKKVFATENIQELFDFHEKSYNAYSDNKDFVDTLVVGDKRRMITIDILGLFNSPDLYANPLLFPLLESLLSKKIILGFFGSVTSVPGAPDQHTHRDNPHIFDQPDVYPGAENVLPVLPPYGISISVPLVPLNEINGTTRMFLGSHLITQKEVRRRCEYGDPEAEIGDCLLMDWRLVHGGTANRSSNVRPILYLEYFRQWYRDVINSKRHILISADEYARIPEEKRYLFDWDLADSIRNPGQNRER